MTSTNYSIGLGENEKSSSKVLRPPGGGSSDIFGSETPATPRSVRNHMISNIFGSTQDSAVKNNGDNARRAGKSADSYNRLFGEPERPFTPAKNHMKSSIPIGGGEKGSPKANGTAMAPPTNGHAAHANKNGKIENGGVDQCNGNGVTKPEKINEENIVVQSNQSHSATDSAQSATDAANANKSGSFIEKDNNLTSSTNGHNTNNNINNIDCNDFSQNLNNNNNNNMKSNNDDNINIITTTTNTAANGNVNNNNHNKNNNQNRNDINGSSCNSSTTTSSSSTVSPVSTHSSNKSSITRSPRFGARNPVTGSGIAAPVEKHRRANNRRDGNPVTGEGYKPAGAEINTTIPSLNGANQVINKNRIPPGGFSSGLW